METISREEAKERGLPRFYTGEPCPSGHTVQRYVSGGDCVECARIKNRAYVTARRAADPSYAASRDGQSKDWAKRHPDKVKAAADKHEKRPERIARKAETTKEWRKANPDKISEHNKRWRAKNPKWHFSATRRAWQELNRDQQRAKLKEYRKNNLEKVKETIRLWRLNNPEKARAAQAAVSSRRRAREREIVGPHFTSKDILLIMSEQGGLCAGCSRADKLEIDHVQPIAKGGNNAPTNVQLLCRSCNARKSDRDLMDWLHVEFQSYLNNVK